MAINLVTRIAFIAIASSEVNNGHFCVISETDASLNSALEKQPDNNSS